VTLRYIKLLLYCNLAPSVSLDYYVINLKAIWGREREREREVDLGDEQRHLMLQGSNFNREERRKQRKLERAEACELGFF
jgi:hypothetical protein